MELPHTTLVAVLGATALVALLALVSALARKGRSEHQARAYLAGFTYVLSDDPDAAIAELSRVAQLSPQTLETYFALGALFRRKGELERAIRLHQNIILRPSLAPEVKRRAQLALALDYKRSRLQDKAAEMLEKILSEDPGNKDALLRYRQILEENGDWPGAVEAQVRLVKLEGRGEAVLAHLLAEAAREAIATSPTEAQTLAAQAVNLLSNSPNAQLALAESLLAQGRAAEAAPPLRSALQLEPELAPKTTRLLLTALGEQQAEQFLTDQIAKNVGAGPAYELALALSFKDRGETDFALRQLRQLVVREPYLWEARKELGTLLLAQNRPEDLRADYQEILATLGHPPMGFVCTLCRQKLPEHAFRCPACEAWDTVKREMRGEKGEKVLI